MRLNSPQHERNSKWKTLITAKKKKTQALILPYSQKTSLLFRPTHLVTTDLWGLPVLFLRLKSPPGWIRAVKPTAGRSPDAPIEERTAWERTTLCRLLLSHSNPSHVWPPLQLKGNLSPIRGASGIPSAQWFSLFPWNNITGFWKIWSFGDPPGIPLGGIDAIVPVTSTSCGARCRFCPRPRLDVCGQKNLRGPFFVNGFKAYIYECICVV